VLSLLQFEEEVEVLPGGNATVARGYSTVINLLAENLDIRTSCIVTRVQWKTQTENPIHGDKVLVNTKNGEVFEADYVIVSVSVGVLRKSVLSLGAPVMTEESKESESEDGAIRFVPQLPEWKVQAILQLKMALMNKVMFHFSKPFWNQKGLKSTSRISRLSSKRGEFGWFLPYDSGVIISWNTGSFAREIEHMTDEEVTAKGVDTLKNICKGDIGGAELLEVVVTRWQANPFFEGSYSFHPVGAASSDNEALGRDIEGKLFFLRRGD